MRIGVLCFWKKAAAFPGVLVTTLSAIEIPSGQVYSGRQESRPTGSAWLRTGRLLNHLIDVTRCRSTCNLRITQGRWRRDKEVSTLSSRVSKQPQIGVIGHNTTIVS